MDADSVSDQKFDVILANINRNIILEDMPFYTTHLKPKGFLLLSGILERDKLAVMERALSLDLSFVAERYENNWISLKFKL